MLVLGRDFGLRVVRLDRSRPVVGHVHRVAMGACRLSMAASGAITRPSSSNSHHAPNLLRNRCIHLVLV